MELTEREKQLARFAVSFLMANLTSAFEDLDEESDLGELKKPSLDELDQLHSKFKTPT